MPDCFLVEPVCYPDPARDVPGKPDRMTDYLIRSWVRRDTGEEHEQLSAFGVGAMWYAFWYPRNFQWDNETLPHLMVRCPSGRDWDIDSRASNCGLPNDRLHRCWVRHGNPPFVTVDKAGHTCNAGGGSILLPEWHGFLQGGNFVSC